MHPLDAIIGDRNLQTPCIFLDEQAVEANYRAVAQAFGRFDIFYSVKANNDPIVLRAIAGLGGSFDVASVSEVRQVLSLGVEAGRIAFSNPIKIPEEVSLAFGHGVRLFAADSEDEIDKIAARAPGSSVYIRLAVANSGSGWPLSSKFGVPAAEALSLLERAGAKELDPAGLTFHVGSQCVNVQNWTSALEQCAGIWIEAKRRGMNLRLLNIGGGVPARYGDGIPAVEEIGRVVDEMVKKMLPDASKLMIEPGRFIVADSAVLVASVIGRAKRDGKTALYLDAGVFNGLMETYECFWYPLRCIGGSTVKEDSETVTLFGPTCDSVDVIVKDVFLPRLSIGDRLIFGHAGAYTNSYEEYNGFAFPDVRSARGLLIKTKEKEQVSAL